MLDIGYLYAKDSTRLFVNTSLGCSGACSYCYLPKLNYLNNHPVTKVLSKDEIINLIKENNYPLLPSTLITIGCFSECFDSQNKPSTIELIKYFLKNGNQVQLSTKQYISYNDLKDIIPLIKYNGQLVIFVSSATITYHEQYEKNTLKISKRFETFKLIKYNIPVVLYIKPVIQDITIKDIDLYKEYIKKYHIEYIVVGSIFTTKLNKETVHFSNRNELFYNAVDDEDKIISELKNSGKIFRRSSDVCNSFKQ